jgi:excisionase family DNA binding protein
MTPYYTPKHICEQFDIKKPTLHYWLQTGRLHSVRFGSLHRIPVTEWERFMEESQKGKKSK